jgi:hypothetical protein
MWTQPLTVLAFLTVVGLAFPALAAARCGLTDLAPHAPPQYDTFEPPAKGQTYVDPAFGCPVRRISDGMADFRDRVHHEYATMSPFNRDDTRILLHTCCEFFVADRHGTVIVPPGTLRIPASAEPRWSRTDPDVFHYHSAHQIWSFNVRTLAHTLVRTFDGYASIDFCGGSSDLSEDGDHLAVCGDVTDVFVYRFSTDATFTARALRDICSAHVTPDNHVLVDACDRVELFDIDMASGRTVAPFGGHLNIGRDRDRSEILLIVGSNDLAPAPGCEGNGVEKIRLPDGAKTCLLPLYWGESAHLSVSDDGWVLVSNTDETAHTPDPDDIFRGTAEPPHALPPSAETEWGTYFNELTLVRVDGTEVRRVAHHRSRRLDDYWHQTRAAISRDGRFAVFDSNFGRDPVPEYTDVYLVNIRSAVGEGRSEDATTP